MTNRKSHTPFQSVPKSTTLDDLRWSIRTLLQRRYFSGPHHKNLNEDRPVQSAAKMLANDSIFWRYKIYANIRGGSMGRGRHTTVWLSTTAIFSDFAGYFRHFRDEASVIIWRYAVRRRLFSDPKMSDFEWLFRANFCFRTGLAGWDRATSENNCAKTNKDRHILPAVQIFGRDSSFWQYKAFADIRRGSLERRRQTTVGSRVMHTCCGRMLKFIRCVRNNFAGRRFRR